MKNTHSIDYRFKILYAVAMIMVVCGHAKNGGISILSDWFPWRGIHLAIFVFCSGYFYKQASESNIVSYILKKVKTLLVPLYIYNILYGLIVQLSRLKGFEIGGDFTLKNLLIMPFLNGHQFTYNMGGWFIAPLFMVEIYNILSRKFLKLFTKNIPEWFFFILNTGLGIIGIYLASKGYNTGVYLMLVRMLYFLPFFELGIFYKNSLEKYDKKIPSFWYFSFLFSAKLIISCIIGKMPTYVVSWCKDFDNGPVLPVIVGFLGIALWLRIATILEPVIGRSKYINLIADNTYSIMINQFLGFMIIKYMYGFIDNIIPLGFNWHEFKTNIWYYCIPNDNKYMLIIYVVAGIVVPIIIQKVIDFTKNLIKIQLEKRAEKASSIIETKQ